MHKWFIVLLVWSVCPCLVYGQEAELKSTKAKAAVREYERKVEDVDKEFEKQLKDLEKSYQMKAELIRARLITNLNGAMEEEARKINLEEANKIKAVVDDAKKYEAPKLGGLMEQAGKKPTKTEKTKAPKVRIPKTAVKFNGHHYAICTEPMVWHVARDYSESLGGHLVSINSREEWNFLSNMFFNRNIYLHIDGTDEVKESEWLFSNGEIVDFSVIPNDKKNINSGTVSHYLTYWKNRVENHINGDRIPFLIEWDK